MMKDEDMPERIMPERIWCRSVEYVRADIVAGIQSEADIAELTKPRVNVFATMTDTDKIATLEARMAKLEGKHELQPHMAGLAKAARAMVRFLENLEN